jgi:hypothetical protein
VPKVDTAPRRRSSCPTRNQAFARQARCRRRLAWKVVGSVDGYAANVVVSRSPSGDLGVIDTGAPIITLTRNTAPIRSRARPNTSPYQGTIVQPSDPSGNRSAQLPRCAEDGEGQDNKPAKPVKKVAAPPAPAAIHRVHDADGNDRRYRHDTGTDGLHRMRRHAARGAPPAAGDQTALPAGGPASVPPLAAVGACKEPLDEAASLRAKALMTWLEAHPAKSAATVRYWLYQNEWVVTGARMGWWHGAEALQTLIAVDQRAQALWGIGAKSATTARQALDEVRAKAKS